MNRIPEPLEAAWTEWKSHLERRCTELNEEVRNYPTPIARCDEQLTRLIEMRSRAIEQLRLVSAADPSRAGESGSAALERVLAGPPASGDDEAENAIRARVKAALAGRQRKV
jgi:hypothetical protein